MHALYLYAVYIPNCQCHTSCYNDYVQMATNKEETDEGAFGRTDDKAN